MFQTSFFSDETHLVPLQQKLIEYLSRTLYNRPNVCKTREEDIEDEGEDEKDDDTVKVDDKDDSLIQAFHLNLETCAEKSNKYQCTKM